MWYEEEELLCQVDTLCDRPYCAIDEKRLALQKAVDDVTKPTSQSLASDLLKGLEETAQRQALADVEISLESGPIVKAHRGM